MSIDLSLNTVNTSGVESIPSIERSWGHGNPDYEGTLSIIVLGASGNLAFLKTFPALYALYKDAVLPVYTRIVGFARTEMTKYQFRDKLKKAIEKKGDPETVATFLERCFYFQGDYNSEESFASLDNDLLLNETGLCKLYTTEGRECNSNRLFYYAIPPSQYKVVTKCIHTSCRGNNGYQRLIIEKPFGKDVDSSRDLNSYIQSMFKESDIYRIDHYLGKEMVQNLLITRFANIIYSALWCNTYIDNIQIIFKETLGIDGRGGYFDEYGIIRDVMQNHLLQIVALLSMEQPLSLHSSDIRDEKVRVLRAIEPLTLEDTVIGQYTEGNGMIGYSEDPSIPKGSITATFAATVMRINTPRWAGVPFYLKCGKALDESKAEIRIQFKELSCPLFKDLNRNELILRVQPDTAIYMKMNMKSPGIATKPITGELDMTYKHKYDIPIPDAYERLILDVVRGDHSHFVRGDELERSWEIFTPLLHEIDEKKIVPIPYARGSRGPPQADVLRDKYGFKRSISYEWKSLEILSPVSGK